MRFSLQALRPKPQGLSTAIALPWPLVTLGGLLATLIHKTTQHLLHFAISKNGQIGNSIPDLSSFYAQNRNFYAL
jgi:hypothetical protein